MDHITPSSTYRERPSLELHIEELVLHGFSRHDRDRIESAITQELTRLFTDQGIPQSFGVGDHALRLEGGSFQITAGRPAQVAGTEIAQAIFAQTLYGGFTDGDANPT